MNGIDDRNPHAEEDRDHERPRRRGEEGERSLCGLGGSAVHAQRPAGPGAKCAGTPRFITMSRAIFGSVSG